MLLLFMRVLVHVVWGFTVLLFSFLIVCVDELGFFADVSELDVVFLLFCGFCVFECE